MTQLTAQQARRSFAAQYHRGGKLLPKRSRSIARSSHLSPSGTNLLQQRNKITYQTGHVDESLELIRKAAGMAPAVAGYTRPILP